MYVVMSAVVKEWRERFDINHHYAALDDNCYYTYRVQLASKSKVKSDLNFEKKNQEKKKNLFSLGISYLLLTPVTNPVSILYILSNVFSTL